MRATRGHVGERGIPNFWLLLILLCETFAPSIQYTDALRRNKGGRQFLQSWFLVNGAALLARAAEPLSEAGLAGEPGTAAPVPGSPANPASRF